jgi:GxxExxY protein
VEINFISAGDFLNVVKRLSKVEDILIVELKAVAEMNPIYEAQLLTYMNLLEKPIGLLINFNVKNIYYEGQQTFVNKQYNTLWD